MKFNEHSMINREVAPNSSVDKKVIDFSSFQRWLFREFSRISGNTNHLHYIYVRAYMHAELLYVGTK